MNEFRDILFSEIYSLAAKDKRVMVLPAEMGAVELDRFKADFKEQFVNVGIAEQSGIDIAAGLALEGKIVFFYGIIPFVTLRCFEQIKVDLCTMKLPVTIVGIGAGFAYGARWTYTPRNRRCCCNAGFASNDSFQSLRPGIC